MKYAWRAVAIAAALCLILAAQQWPGTFRAWPAGQIPGIIYVGDPSMTKGGWITWAAMMTAIIKSLPSNPGANPDQMSYSYDNQFLPGTTDPAILKLALPIIKPDMYDLTTLPGPPNGWAAASIAVTGLGVYKNGIRQHAGLDYSLYGTAVAFIKHCGPNKDQSCVVPGVFGDIIYADYGLTYTKVQ